MRKAQSGFTLIELVIVIVILGILAATALPRFIDITDDAHEAAVAGAGGGLGAGVSLAHALWLARGEPGSVTMEGATVTMNTSGWPDATGAGDCITNAWEGVMQNPPNASTGSGSNVDYVASFTDPVCTFTYDNATGMTITYDDGDGSIVVDDEI